MDKTEAKDALLVDLRAYLDYMYKLRGYAALGTELEEIEFDTVEDLMDELDDALEAIEKWDE